MNIHYRPFGGTGIQVSTFALGTMMFGAVDGSDAGNPDRGQCVRIVHEALDAGINFVDTADVYSHGEAEEILGEALRGRRDDVVLATKFHFPVDDVPTRRGNSRRWIVQAVEASLRRLGTDWIDLYQVHRPDEDTELEETLATLTDLVREGKIRAFGTSSFPAHLVEAAHATAERRGLMRPRTEQPPYSLIGRGVERDLLPVCQAHAMGVLTWSPLAFGFLSGRYGRTRPVDLASGRPGLRPDRFDPDLPANAAKYDALESLGALAEELGRRLPELAHAFPLAHPGVTSVILGPRSSEQLRASLAGADLQLSDEVLDRIDEIVPPGVDLWDVNAAWRPRSLTDPTYRRRQGGQRAAGG